MAGDHAAPGLQRFYRELSQSEVASALGISQVHVSRLLAKALSRLRATAG